MIPFPRGAAEDEQTAERNSAPQVAAQTPSASEESHLQRRHRKAQQVTQQRENIPDILDLRIHYKGVLPLLHFTSKKSGE